MSKSDTSGFDFTGESARPERDKARSTPRNSKRSDVKTTVWITSGVVLIIVLVGSLFLIFGPKKHSSSSSTSPTTIHQFGEEVVYGDLRVTIEFVMSGEMTGIKYGEWGVVHLMLAKIKVVNMSNGIIADWPGLQGKMTVEDEHGNSFEPANLRGWKQLPFSTDTVWDGDYPTRIHPGKVYENAVYFEIAPTTSKVANVKFVLDGFTERYRGPLWRVADYFEMMEKKRNNIPKPPNEMPEKGNADPQLPLGKKKKR